jgi:hypothetical protein
MGVFTDTAQAKPGQLFCFVVDQTNSYFARH